MQAKTELTKKPRESSFCLDPEPVDEEKELRVENMQHCQAKYPCSTLPLLLQDSVKKHFAFIKRHPLIPVLWILIYVTMCGAIVWGRTVCITVSFIASALFYGVMIHKQVQTDEIREKSDLLVQEAMETVRAQAELNDYIAHEIRGPLSAAMSACAFVSSSINEIQPLEDKESQTALKEDVAIIDASLQFVNDLLRSILDLSRATNNQLTLHEVPVDILSDILQPVAAMLYQRDRNFQVLVDCPENLVVITDRLRLKQVILNLGRNAVKF
jgi:signal transduction histidine kinase